MATGTDAIIMSALLDRLATFVTTPALQIAYPGIAFPATGQPLPDSYLQASFMPNRTDTLSVGIGRQRHQGIFQVSVWWKSGQGLVKPFDVAGAIIDHFAKGTRLTSGDVVVQINRKPWSAGPLQEADRVQIPVSAPYVSFNQ